MQHRWDECCNRLVDAMRHEDRGYHVAGIGDEAVIVIFEAGWPVAWQDGPDFVGPVTVPDEYRPDWYGWPIALPYPEFPRYE